MVYITYRFFRGWGLLVLCIVADGFCLDVAFTSSGGEWLHTTEYVLGKPLSKKDINHLTPNGHSMGRTAQLTSRCRILYIYSTNIRTEYFKHAAYSPFFFSSNCRLFHNATFFGSCIIHILNTGCAKI